MQLENTGEVNVGLAEHKTTRQDDGAMKFEALQPVAFVLDPVKEKKRKKAKWCLTNNLPDPCTKRVSQQSLPLKSNIVHGGVAAFKAFFKPGQVTAMTFGTEVPLEKLRLNKNILILWRMRPGVCAGLTLCRFRHNHPWP